MVQAGYDMVLENVGLEIINEEGDMGVNVLSAHLLTNIAQPVYQDLVETVISSMERLGLGRSTKSLKQYLGKVKNLKKAPT